MNIPNLLRVIANVMAAPRFDQEDMHRCVIGLNKDQMNHLPGMSPVQEFAHYLDMPYDEALKIWVSFYNPEDGSVPDRARAIRMLLRLGETGKVVWYEAEQS